jgi:hypothetical protein
VRATTPHGQFLLAGRRFAFAVIPQIRLVSLIGCRSFLLDCVLMGRYRGGGQRKSWEKNDPHGRKLDPRQFPELNAVFYTADPAAFIKMRIEALSLMACDDESLAPAFASNRMIGSVSFGGMPVPSREARQSYLRTEAVAIVHHASEALLRLFFAHVQHPECPWLGMSASTNFGEFKSQVDDALDRGLNRDHIASVFLGGSTPEDSCIELTAEEFEDTVDAMELLLVNCAVRFLRDSFLYNAVKHGLTAIDIDDETARFEWRNHDGEQVPMHKGPVHGYLHKKLDPSASDNEKQWFLSLDDPNPERDLAIATLITYAMDSLWNVARRRYMGSPGSVFNLSKGSVELAIYGPIMQARNLLQCIAFELIKVKPDGDVDATVHHARIHKIPEEWTPEDGMHQPAIREVALPVRQQDLRIYSTSQYSYLPIVPRGFQRG